MPRDGSTLPIVLEGAAHTFALRTEASKRGFQTFVTGALTADGTPDICSGMLADAHASLPGFAQGAEAPATVPADAPPLLVISDLHMSSYPMMLPSPADLKSRGITHVKVGLENEDLGPRTVEEYVAHGQPAQRALALQLLAYRKEGLAVDLVGLDQPRDVASNGARPWQTSQLKRLAWEQGVGGDPAIFDATATNLPTIDAYLDGLVARYEPLGPAFGAQLKRIADARAEAHAAVAATANH